ncbi:YgzB family protein [Cohnella sp. WQ 127256]|uniref:YgzB family protein n=1 Tax=Cohnella sp. WQ 127256 TaxID=2938790 RepID=UPI002118458B|nr:YgzB family protein [Cohnella sp. WQ 127256]
MKWKASKISTLRTWGLLLVLIGMGVMVFGTSGILMFGEVGKIIAAIFMVLGMLSCFASIAIYFWVGMLSTSAPVIDCPECSRRTKMLGKTDRCMYCHTILTLDPSIANDKGAANTEPNHTNDTPLQTQQ